MTNIVKKIALFLLTANGCCRWDVPDDDVRVIPAPGGSDELVVGRNADGTDNFFVSSPKKKQQKVRPQCNRIEYYSFKCFSFISIEINFESRREVSLICSTYFSLHSFKKNTSYTYSILINLNWFLPNFVFQGNRLDSLMSSDSYFLFCLMLHLVA